MTKLIVKEKLVFFPVGQPLRVKFNPPSLPPFITNSSCGHFREWTTLCKNNIISKAVGPFLNNIVLYYYDDSMRV